MLTEEGKPDIDKTRPIVYSPEAQKINGIDEFFGFPVNTER
jgi:hypothetical protein